MYKNNFEIMFDHVFSECFAKIITKKFRILIIEN